MVMWHEMSPGTDCEALPSVCCARTSWPPTNSTFIGVLSFRTRCTRRIASLLACADNGRILLANLFLCDRAAVATLDSPCSWAFNDGICEAHLRHFGVRQQYPGGYCWPTS